MAVSAAQSVLGTPPTATNSRGVAAQLASVVVREPIRCVRSRRRRNVGLAQLTLLLPIEQCLEPHPTYPFVDSSQLHSRPQLEQFKNRTLHELAKGGTRRVGHGRRDTTLGALKFSL